MDSTIFEVEDESKVFQIPPNNSVEIQSILGGRWKSNKTKKRVVYSKVDFPKCKARPMTIKLNMHTARYRGRETYKKGKQP